MYSFNISSLRPHLGRLLVGNQASDYHLFFEAAEKHLAAPLIDKGSAESPGLPVWQKWGAAHQGDKSLDETG